MSHAAEYLIVAGVAWLRRSTEADWAITFDDRAVRKGREAGSSTNAAASVSSTASRGSSSSSRSPRHSGPRARWCGR